MDIISSFSRIIRVAFMGMSTMFSAPCIPLVSVAESPTNDFVSDPKIAARYITATNLKSMITGSGSIIGPNYGLTAAHVCVPTESWAPGEWIYQAYDRNGNWDLIFPVIIDFDNDVCIFAFENPVASWLLIAKTGPEINEEVYYIGFPRGVYHPMVHLKFRGYYGGKFETKALYTIPAAPGSSGSAIYNSRNEVVGMVSMVVDGFQHVTIGPELVWIQRAYQILLENPNTIVIIANNEISGMSLVPTK